MGKPDAVQVEFEDSPGTLYSYFTGGLDLEVGDLVVTPAPSKAGRFGIQRYNRQGVAAVVGTGRGYYTGPLKTLTGKITTKSGRTKKARWFQNPLESAIGATSLTLHTGPYVEEISGTGYSRQDQDPHELMIARIAALEDTVENLQVQISGVRSRMSIGYRYDTHTHSGPTSPPKRIR